jgi:ABC-type oligopeptide transport system substrate-binding subunit
VIRKPFAASIAVAKAQTRGEPFDIAVENWYPDYPDPADVLNVLMSGSAIRSQLNTNQAYFNDPVYNRKLAAAARLTGVARLRAYSRLDVKLAARAAPYVPIDRAWRSNFYSARIGCQVFSPVPRYEIDITALCLRK